MAMEKKSREMLAAEQARKEAEIFAAGKNREEIERELKRLDKGPGLFGWIRDRINSFFNFVKIATMSVLLGRRETAKRMDAGTIEAEQKAREDAAAKLAKQMILKEKLAEMDQKKEQSQEFKDFDKVEPGENRSGTEQLETEDKTVQESERQQQAEHPENEQKQANKAEQEVSAQDLSVLEAQYPESEKTDAQTISAPAAEQPKRETILAQQCREMTDSYKQGLAEYIENLTGIKKDAFTIGNTDGKIRVDFALLCEQMKGDSIPYRNGVTLDAYGCTAEGRKSEFSKMLGTAILYYTAEVYRDSKNQTQFPGTRPSDRMLKEVIGKLQGRLEENEKNGKPPRNFSQPLFGHVLTVGINQRGEEKKMFLSIDGGKGKMGELSNLVSWAKQDIVSKIEGRSEMLEHTFYVNGEKRGYMETDRHFGGDYGKMTQYSEIFHKYRDDMIHSKDMPFHCAKYYEKKELIPLFSKKLNDMLLDGKEVVDQDGNRSPALVRGFDCGDCHYHVELQKDGDALSVKGVLLSRSSHEFEQEGYAVSAVYGEICGFNAENGYNELTDNIARHMADSYVNAHEIPGYDFEIDEFKDEPALIPQAEIDDSMDKEAMLEADELSL